MKKIWFRKIFSYIFIGFGLLWLVFITLNQPSNNKNWSADQAILPHSVINGDHVTIYNIRNFSYQTADQYLPAYYNKIFDLNKLESVWFVVEPFAGYKGAAHTFLSFGFGGNNFVSVSVEIRKEKGESFSALKGLFRQYEITYVIADENDVIKLRSNYRHDQVYLYPVKSSPEKNKALFLAMLKRANDLKDQPEFYNTFTNTCTTNIVKHVNQIMPDKIPFSFKILLPASSDELAYTLGLIDTNLSFEKAREKFLINTRAEQFANDSEFSIKIRSTN